MRGRLNGRRNGRAFGCASGRALHIRTRINDLTSEFSAGGRCTSPSSPRRLFSYPGAFACARREMGGRERRRTFENIPCRFFSALFGFSQFYPARPVAFNYNGFGRGQPEKCRCSEIYRERSAAVFHAEETVEKWKIPIKRSAISRKFGQREKKLSSSLSRIL